MSKWAKIALAVVALTMLCGSSLTVVHYRMHRAELQSEVRLTSDLDAEREAAAEARGVRESVVRDLVAARIDLVSATATVWERDRAVMGRKGFLRDRFPGESSDTRRLARWLIREVGKVDENRAIALEKQMPDVK